VKALLITGDTYPHRHEIKAAGGKWDPSMQGWVTQTNYDRHREIAATHNLTIAELEDYTPPSYEDRLQYRKAKMQRKADRLGNRAEKLEKEADGIDAAHTRNGYKDWAFITQPILVGHHSEKSFRNLKERISKQLDKQCENRLEAKELTSKAASLEKAASGAYETKSYMQNRIDEADRELRSWQADLDGTSSRSGYKPAIGERRTRILDYMKEPQEKRDYWAKRMIEAGGVTYNNENIHAGDLVKISGRWEVVSHANPKTVGIKFPQDGCNWDIKYKYAEIQEHRPPLTKKEVTADISCGRYVHRPT
jgi:hypothetical protein